MSKSLSGDLLSTRALFLRPKDFNAQLTRWLHIANRRRVRFKPQWQAGQGPGIDFPLWAVEDPSRLILTADSSAAIGAGLPLRPLADTIAGTHAFETQAHTIQKAGIGISAERELELLRTLA